MNADGFYVAQQLEKDGWEFLYELDDGDMVFARTFLSIVYTAKVAVDK